MNPDDIKKNRIYKSAVGSVTRRVQSIDSVGKVKFRESTQRQQSTDLRTFAAWAAQDVTPAPSTSVRLAK